MTGGAGFIAAHVAHELLGAGYQVRALDCLSPQVHGELQRRPAYLPKQVELFTGDVRDRSVVRKSLEGVTGVIHLAAMVGVGQSMYQMMDYTDVNATGTAVLMSELVDCGVKRIVVASSMSIYGEGRYRDSNGRIVDDADRSMEQIQRGEWDIVDETRGPLTPVPTPEDKRPSLRSVYALSKFYQEQLCLVSARAYGISAVALRLFNVYGPFQALSNPYTGVLAIFAARLLNGQRPLINEDGLQRRDFVSVYDVARAFRLALESTGANGRAINIGSGRSYTIVEVAELMAKALGRPDLGPVMTGKVRIGDIRHCYADLTQAKKILDFTPAHELRKHVAELAAWLRDQVAEDRVEAARAELESRGLAI
jgi:dTDP-L-rhamnose 4-epimerase